MKMAPQCSNPSGPWQPSIQREFSITKRDTVDNSEIWRSPVEGKVVHPIILQGFSAIPGGWPCDF